MHMTLNSGAGLGVDIVPLELRSRFQNKLIVLINKKLIVFLMVFQLAEN